MREPRFREVIDLGGNTEVTIRPIAPADAARQQAFVRELSPASRRLRFLSAISELSPAMLEQSTRNDYPRAFAIVATVPTPEGEKQVGVARYAEAEDPGHVEFAVVVADDWRGRGLATQLLKRLYEIVRELPIHRIEGMVLRENRHMLQLADELGFGVENDPEDPLLLVVYLDLPPGGETRGD